MDLTKNRLDDPEKQMKQDRRRKKKKTWSVLLGCAQKERRKRQLLGERQETHPRAVAGTDLSEQALQRLVKGRDEWSSGKRRRG